MTREKELYIAMEVKKFLVQRYKSKIMEAIQGNQQVVD